ncbi:TPA: hypothetical protein QCU10_000256 [Bacillus anthracis]|uniref:Uncharacterized protein n=1 Tax=Bacillus paranthracis TaxID=2026186 RepID=A0A5M9H0A6_9BACI|nr:MULTISPECIES: hypothetical protein [Bacillus cereus group]HDR4495702.1 hypothetical protein [Bacillus cereus biovar anthracis]ADK06908.1 hypothetical protein BACI_c43120 [Bacillus cereus biovar anthracis str. CI]KAA8479007.1 hypothetical protein FYW06_09005 [Bacillus paranthracis]MCU5253994.1 hypothetical protein [Bacillus cereus]MDZ4466017.1 hypothetical protein [Bacillus cereus]
MESQLIDDVLQHGINFGKSLKKKNVNVVAVGQKLNHLQQNNQEKFIELYFELVMKVGIPVNTKLVTGDKTIIHSFLIGLSQEF